MGCSVSSNVANKHVRKQNKIKESCHPVPRKTGKKKKDNEVRQ